MPTLQLQVEIDSEVHPELYALLTAVGRASLRPERLRQLAAGGLIWEHLRAQPRLDAGAGPALAESARTADGSALERALARVSAAPAEPVSEEPPVLQDVVELPGRAASRSRSRGAAGKSERTREPREATDREKSAAVSATEAVPPVPADEPPAATTPPDETVAKKPGTRSRLLLMRERGLFKNG
ncbi:hypothetical protein [uncultured Piscinibacter sp.]|uniref:hypothetical protein n=1 Tax=uncultured Piscinibacter sp. TaxID=1131835 RepID=UPI002622C537|nr:hypothetical protein [uncultured Piscinibacter sp.]